MTFKPKSTDLEHAVGNVVEAAHIATVMVERCLDGGRALSTTGEHETFHIHREDEAALLHAIYALKAHARELSDLYHGQADGGGQ